jgi:hypothetical protein
MWARPLGYKGVNLGWTIEYQRMEIQQAKGCIATCLQQSQTYNWQIKRGEWRFYLVLVEQKDHDQKKDTRRVHSWLGYQKKGKRVPRLFLDYFLQITFTWNKFK